MACWSWFSMLPQVLLLVSWAVALDISYCSPDNTGSSSQRGKTYTMLRLNHILMIPAVQTLFQSNGACQDTCSSNYAFAVIQGQNCWCSDYAPGYSVNTLNCKDPCPGYPTEWCGSLSSGLYAYFQLTRSPSGTSALSSAQPSKPPGSSVSGPLTTEFPSLHTFPGPSYPPPDSSQVQTSPSMLPALTVLTTQSTAPASSSEQPTVTITEQASAPRPFSSV